MKKQIFALTVAAVTWWSCNTEIKTTATTDSASTIETDSITGDSASVVDGHNAKNSLDWAGTYKGTTPCADCEGIETEVTLTVDSTYVIKAKYLGKDAKVFQQNGNFNWDKSGSIIVLSDVKDRPSQFFVGENTLTQLDIEGRRITGALADQYVLRKY